MFKYILAWNFQNQCKYVFRKYVRALIFWAFEFTLQILSDSIEK